MTRAQLYRFPYGKESTNLDVNVFTNDDKMALTNMVLISVYLSRYGNNPGPRHIEFLKHLLKYCKYSKMDRLKFHTHDGPTDIETMTQVLQLRFQCDADLRGNLDN